MEAKDINKKRLVYLDFIKVFAIYFVCLYHYNNLPTNFLEVPSKTIYFNYLVKGIASTGVPLFFMVNGALMLNKDYNLKKHIGKIINIIGLTFIWGIITLIILGYINVKEYTPVEFRYSLWTWEIGRINHLWFMQALVCVYLLFPLIKDVYDKEDKSLFKYITILLFILTFGNVILNIIANISKGVFGYDFIAETFGIISIVGNGFNFFNNFNVFRGFYAYVIVYFILGGIILKRLNTKDNVKLSYILVLFIVSIISLGAYGVMLSNMNQSIYDLVWNGYDTIMTMAISVSIFGLCYYFRNSIDKISKVVQLVGTNTIGIYFVHRIIGEIARPIFVQMANSTSLMYNILFGIVVMGISLIVVIILKKIPIIKLLFKI